MIRYSIGSSRQTLLFSDAVLSHFWRWRQSKPWQSEAGGQLFGRLVADEIEIVEATGPRTRDRRTPWSYQPCRDDEQVEIDERHQSSLVFLGNWHTHWQRRPRPSTLDRWNVGDIVRRSHHGMLGLLMVIAGYARPPSGLYVSICDGDQLHELMLRAS